MRDKTTMVSATDSVKEYILGQDWRIKANANTGYSNAGLVSNLAGKLVANFWLDSIYSKEEGEAHRSGDYHIHDLDSLTGYCAGWSLRVLLDEGFNGVEGRNTSNPPKHFRNALDQMVNFLGILQSEWAGAQAFSSFDTYLAPYVFKDDLDYKEVKKCIRSFIYGLNVPARWGQSPFTNITLDWTVPRDLREQIPTSNQKHLFSDMNLRNAYGLYKKAQGRDPSIERLEYMTYKHFEPEMQMIQRAYYEVMTEGDANGNPFTFPIPTVNITEDFDWEGPNVDILFENTAKVGSSYFQNFIGSQYITDADGNKVENPEAYKPGAVRSMCCRLQLDLRELLKRGGGLFGSAEMTGSIGVVTLNMARLGYLCRNMGVEAIYPKLDRLLELAYSTLEKKRMAIQDLYERGLYPYTKRYLHHFNNHFSTIGVNGMNEMLLNLTNGDFDITHPEGKHIAETMLEYIRNRMKEFQERSGNLYNLEATPAEGTTYRFAKEDKKRFGNHIIQAGFGEHVYYTNASQLPANYTDDPFEALMEQDSLQCKYTGGTVLHLYMNERVKDGATCKALVKKALTNFKLPYITVTPLFSVCPKHGYLNGEFEYCPKCDEEILKSTKGGKCCE